MSDENKSREELIAELEALRRENQELKSGGQTSRKQTILVVDDNEETREIVQDMVEELGYPTMAAANPEDAVSVFSRNPNQIDLMITDIVMPEGDGPDLVREILKISPRVKVIFMSGYAEDEIVHDAVYKVQDTNAAFIKKPFTLADIRILIDQQLGDTGDQG